MSIDGEPLPSADPLVLMLLETACATDLLAYYANTLGPAATETGAPSRNPEKPALLA